MTTYSAHPAALVESESIGAGTRIWAFTHILADAVIGCQCNIGDHCFIESGAVIGDGVTIKNNTTIWEGVTIEQYAFIGPNVVFTNDPRPRSPRCPVVAGRYQTKDWLRTTHIQEGASIGANVTIVCGVTIGMYAMIGAGTLVTRDVPPYALVYGSPGRVKGFVCVCGGTLAFLEHRAQCSACQTQYINEHQTIRRIVPPS